MLRLYRDARFFGERRESWLFARRKELQQPKQLTKIDLSVIERGLELGSEMAGPPKDTAETQGLLQRVRNGDREAFERLFALHRAYLRQVVDFRMAGRLRVRVDPSDIVQETQLEAFRRLEDYVQREPMGFRLWLRKTASRGRLTTASLARDAGVRSGGCISSARSVARNTWQERGPSCCKETRDPWNFNREVVLAELLRFEPKGEDNA